MVKVEEIRLTINDPKTGKSYKKIINDNLFLNRKLGETVNGNMIGLDGYELKITGGSDDSGFPMRKEIEGQVKAKPLLRNTDVGFKVKKRRTKHSCKHHYHLQKRKTVRGNTISDQTSQINLSVVKAGAQALDAVFGAQQKPAGEQ